MSEADMKCKVAPRLLPSFLSDSSAQAAYLLHSSSITARLTRSRKVAAEDAFCYEFSVQTNRLRLTARSSSRDEAKNEDGKLAADIFVGSNGQQ